MFNLPQIAPDTVLLAELHAAALAAGRECVVGGLIRNPADHIFAQKRAPDRALFPGCWDIAGGHVDPGEALIASLAREINEETGWSLMRVVALVKVFDWETTGPDGVIIPKREFDFVVEVEGDLDHPQLETTKFSEFRWIGLDDLDLLRENRAPGDDAIYEVVGAGLALLDQV